MDKDGGVYRQFYFDKETQETYLVHGTIEDGFVVFLNEKGDSAALADYP